MPPLARPDRDRTVELPPRTATFGGATEVLVVGCGPAGLGAAIGAAKAGAEVVLVERYGFLGGNATAALVMPLMSFHNEVRSAREADSAPAASEVQRELLRQGASLRPGLDIHQTA